MAIEPTAYKLNDPAELLRLFRECKGYLHTCRRDHHGTDRKGRQFAMDALDQLIAKTAPTQGVRSDEEEAEKVSGTNALKQFKDDIAATPQIPLGVEIHNQADEWRIAALEVGNARLRDALKQVIAVADRDTKEFRNAKDLLLSFVNEQASGNAVTDAGS